MKLIKNLCSMVTMFTMLSLISCKESDSLFSDNSDKWVTGIYATTTDVIADVDQTRALAVSPTGSLSFSWADGDVLGIYPIGGDQVAFPISDGAGTKTAKFDGGSWALRANFRYAAYYPFSADNYHIAQTEIPVSLTGQVQDGNNNLSMASSFDYQAAAAVQPNENGSVMLDFNHLCCFMKLYLTMARPGTYTHVKVTSNNTPFATKATFDLTDAAPALSATETSSSVSMYLTNFTTTTANEEVIVYNLVVPVNMVGSKLSVEVIDNAGNKYAGVAEADGKNMIAGRMCGYRFTVDATGTGGSGSDIPAEDEYEYVDLGLPSGTLWATYNVGATKPEEYGDMFAWGEITPKTEYYSSNYKYSPDVNNKYTNENNLLKPEDDAATMNWGSEWCMPTRGQIIELAKNCSFVRTTLNNIDGYEGTGPNGNKIFFPLPGNFTDDILCFRDVVGSYWSKNLESAGVASDLDFNNFGYDVDINHDYVYHGQSIRAVRYMANPVIDDVWEREVTYAMLIPGPDFNVALRSLALGKMIDWENDRDFYDLPDESIQNIIFENNSNVNTGLLLSTQESQYPIYANFDANSGIVTISTKAHYIELPERFDFSFFNMKSLTEIQNLEMIDTQKVTNMECMFGHCESLISVDFSSFNTQKVTRMNTMFSGCSALTSLDLSSFDTQNVTNMSFMFHECSALTSLDLSSFDTQNATNMNFMFHDCSALTALDLSSFNTQNATNMSWMFHGCSALTSLDLSSFNTHNVIDMSAMFAGCRELTSLNLSSFNTQNVTYMNSMFEGCSALTSLDLSSFNTHNVIDMSLMFEGCSALTSLNLSSFDTQYVTNMSAMFGWCPSLNNLNLSSFNLVNIENIDHMLAYIGQNCQPQSVNIKCTEAVKTILSADETGCPKYVTWDIVQ